MTYKILVTGGSGFIGTNLLASLENEGHALCNLDIATPRNPAQEHLWQKVDILDAPALEAALQTFSPDYVFHLAARTDMDGKSLHDYDANIAGVRNIINAIKATHGVRRTLFASSRLVCKIGYMPVSDTDYNATTVYGQSKVEGEKVVRSEAADHFPWLIMRPTSIWGPWFDVPYRNFFDTLKQGVYVHPTKRKLLKSYGYVGNSVAQLKTMLMHADESAVLEKTFYLCDYPPLEVREWADLISRHLNARRASTVPYALIKFMALGGDILKKLGYLSAPITSFRLDNIMTPMVHETAATEKLCGELPYSLEDGVRETCAWLRDHPR
ncbi:NAD-dependent epimerase/dehydratase family protein [Kordiimonas aestuarii]|uniref:NAD-dependent epimerase/dehydratase family protein n=1 Tax=Kordiimonas aestuarii TaxID=1005925 RepID=UPI0021D35A30|nr:NAD(P)-dependent oxidoreductase [Kordiimonas aestuarii]